MKKLALAAVIAASAAASVHAEEYRSGVTFTPSIGHYMFDKDRNVDDGVAYGAALGYQLSNPLAIEFNFLTMDTEFEDSSNDVDFDQYRLDALYHFNVSPKVRPYVALGGGENQFKVGDTKIKDNLLNAGGGVKYFVNDSLEFRGDIRTLYSLDEEDTDVTFNFGLAFLLGAEPRRVATVEEPAPAYVAPAPQPAADPDSDGDGVNDRQDKCPDTTPGVMVDANGCELDSDKDGVVNSKDACPDTALGARVDARGCYEVLKETRSFNLKVNFANASFVIPDEQKSDIASLAKFMTEYPQTRVVIEGHTDDRGSDSYNQKLSDSRAKAVAGSLVADFGIAAGRVSSAGKGESSPIADNNTAEGRAENRRVVALVSATVDVIKK